MYIYIYIYIYSIFLCTYKSIYQCVCGKWDEKDWDNMRVSALWGRARSYRKPHWNPINKHINKLSPLTEAKLTCVDWREPPAHDFCFSFLNYSQGSCAAGVTRNHMAEVVAGPSASARNERNELRMPGGVTTRPGRSRQVRGALWPSLSLPPRQSDGDACCQPFKGLRGPLRTVQRFTFLTWILELITCLLLSIGTADLLTHPRARARTPILMSLLGLIKATQMFRSTTVISHNMRSIFRCRRLACFVRVLHIHQLWYSGQDCTNRDQEMIKTRENIKRQDNCIKEKSQNFILKFKFASKREDLFPTWCLLSFFP